jgi:hypothetical protein
LVRKKQQRRSLIGELLESGFLFVLECYCNYGRGISRLPAGESHKAADRPCGVLGSYLQAHGHRPHSTQAAMADG